MSSKKLTPLTFRVALGRTRMTVSNLTKREARRQRRLARKAKKALVPVKESVPKRYLVEAHDPDPRDGTVEYKGQKIVIRDGWYCIPHHHFMTLSGAKTRIDRQKEEEK